VITVVKRTTSAYAESVHTDNIGVMNTFWTPIDKLSRVPDSGNIHNEDNFSNFETQFTYLKFETDDKRLNLRKHRITLAPSVPRDWVQNRFVLEHDTEEA